MPWRHILLLLVFLLAPVFAAQAQGGAMFLQSPAFADGATLPGFMTCRQQGLSPGLSWGGVPAGTQSLALAVTDPDAPSGAFTHWLVWGMDPQTTALPQGVAPEAAGLQQGRNDFGRRGYGGACPPPGSGPHRYVFTLYALAVRPDLQDGAGRAAFDHAIEGHILATARLTGLYEVH